MLFECFVKEISSVLNFSYRRSLEKLCHVNILCFRAVTTQDRNFYEADVIGIAESARTRCSDFISP